MQLGNFGPPTPGGGPPMMSGGLPVGQGMPPQGMTPQPGMTSQTGMPQGIPPQGMLPQPGMPLQGMPPQSGIPPQGMPPQPGLPAPGVSTLPLPPTHYIAMYTDDNVKKGKAPPPPPLIRDAFSVFSVRHHPSDPIIQPLEAQGIKRLYPQNVDHKKELKKMNHSLLANFLDLLDVMVKNPGGPKYPGSPPPGVGSLREEKIEDIQLLFFHMHHLINEFRPHQARETLRVMMDLQRQQRLDISQRFNVHLEQVTKMLQNSLSELSSQERDLSVLEPSASETELASGQRNVDQAKTAVKDNMMCNLIDEWGS